MKAKILLCALSTLSACKNAEAPVAPEAPVSQYESTAGIFHLPPPDLALAEKKAEAGDNVQLKRVIDHYMLGGDEETTVIKRKRVYWIKLGVVRGIEGAPENLLFYANEISGPPCKDVYDFYKNLEAVWKIVFEGFPHGVRYDSGRGCGPKRAVAGFPKSSARRSGIRAI